MSLRYWHALLITVSLLVRETLEKFWSNNYSIMSSKVGSHVAHLVFEIKCGDTPKMFVFYPHEMTGSHIGH